MKPPLQMINRTGGLKEHTNPTYSFQLNKTCQFLQPKLCVTFDSSHTRVSTVHTFVEKHGLKQLPIRNPDIATDLLIP